MGKCSRWYVSTGSRRRPRLNSHAIHYAVERHNDQGILSRGNHHHVSDEHRVQLARLRRCVLTHAFNSLLCSLPSQDAQGDIPLRTQHTPAPYKLFCEEQRTKATNTYSRVQPFVFCTGREAGIRGNQGKYRVPSNFLLSDCYQKISGVHAIWHTRKLTRIHLTLDLSRI